MLLFLSQASPDLLAVGDGNGYGQEHIPAPAPASAPTFLQEPEILSTLVVLMWGKT